MITFLNDDYIIQFSEPEEFYQLSASRFIVNFVGSSNMLHPDFIRCYIGQHCLNSLKPK